MDKKSKLLGNFENIFKIFDENSIEKLNFYFILFYILFFILFFENLLLKIKPSKITPVFYNNFFRFREGGFPPFPLATPLISKIQMETRGWKYESKVPLPTNISQRIVLNWRTSSEDPKHNTNRCMLPRLDIWNCEGKLRGMFVECLVSNVLVIVQLWISEIWDQTWYFIKVRSKIQCIIQAWEQQTLH